ncbi:MAG TPA: hypothetical protein VL049_10335 [Candidatus Dormibacteraeota bacterium]|nr:hypothetical protein [Candidatus Dormibacteraeota bacterium]
MPAASQAFALIRVPHGQSRPSDDQLRAALQADRESISQPAPQAPTEMQVAGPYHILVDGTELDEYVVWER